MTGKVVSFLERAAGRAAQTGRDLVERLGLWPLLFPALGAGAGVALTDWFRAVPGWIWLGPALLAALVGASLLPNRGRWWLIGALAVGGFGILHEDRLDSYQEKLAELRELAADGQLWVRMTGVVVEPPVRLPGSEDRWAGVVRSENWRDLHHGEGSRRPGRFQVFFDGVPPAYGDRIRLRGRLQLPGSTLHPWQRDPVQLAERRDELGRISVRGEEGWAWVEGECASWWRARALESRAWIERQLERGLDPDEAGVVKALVLGMKREAPEGIEERFRHSGGLHLFAVSGLHVGMVGLIAAWVLRLLGLSIRWRTLVVAGVALGYAFVTGWSPSAARASVMLALVMTGLHLERPAAGINSLCAAVLLLLGADTQRLFQVGFQLSCLVVAGIMVGAGWFRAVLAPWAEPDPFLPRALLARRQRWMWGLRRGVLGLVAMSAAAWLASAPLIWFHFSMLTPSGLMANLLLVPLGFVVMSAAVGSMLTGLVPLPLGWLQLAANQLAGLSAAALASLAGFFSALPGGSLYLAWPPEPMQWIRPEERVRLEVMEPGYGGGAALMEIGRTGWLLDTGSTKTWAAVTDRLLARRGYDRLAGIWLSHGDAGHSGGLQRVFDWREVGRLLAAPMNRRTSGGRLLSDFEQWRDSDGAAGSEPRPPVMPERLVAGNRVEMSGVGELDVRALVLHPAADDSGATSDDNALVVRFDIGSWRLLWMSDAGWETEMDLLRRWPMEELASDVVLKGWHGRDESGVDAFWEAVAPRVVVVGWPGPREGLGRDRLMSLWRRQGAAVFQQEDSGHVRLDFRPGQLEVRGWKDARERVLPR